MMLNRKLTEQVDELDRLAMQAQVTNDLDSAMRYYQQILELAPGSALSYVNMATIAMLQGNYDGAITCDELALKLQPDTPQIHNHLGIAYQKAGRKREAIAQFELALTLTPEDPFTLCNFAGVCNEDYTTARELFSRVFKPLIQQFEEKGLQEELFFTDIQANALVCYVNICLDMCDWEAAQKLQPLLEIITRDQLLGGYQPAITPSLASLLFKDQNFVLAIAQSYASAHSIDRAKRFNNFIAPNDKIHIAYIYDTLHSYIYDKAFVELVKKHDKSKFIVSIIHTKALDETLVKELHTSVANFIDIEHLAFYAAATQIHEHGVHILLDTMGFNQDARPEILNFQPAVVQVNFLGYPGTIGCESVEFMVADEQLIPEDDNKYYSEKLIKLPNVMAFPALALKANLKRADFGLPNDKIVFANFSAPIMINNEIFTAWMDILTQAPNSVLWLNHASEFVKTALLRQAQSLGIASNRILFTKYDPMDSVLLHQLCDIYLDTTLVNCDYNIISALYHSKPVVSVKGDNALARITYSILHAADNLAENLFTTANNVSGYKALAVSLATDARLYKAQKAKINHLKANSALFNQTQYVTQFEQALQNILQLQRF